MRGKSTDYALSRDILEWNVPEEVLAVLLKDRSTGRNLIWATDDYAARGKGFGANDEMQVAQIVDRDHPVIRPRVDKNAEEQRQRSVKRAVQSIYGFDWQGDNVLLAREVEKELYKKVRAYIAAARAKVYTVANEEMVKAYWNVGREIVEKQGGGGRSVYGDGLVDRLAIKLTAEFGPGYTRVNLFYMRRFYLAFPKVHTLCKQLSWSHYRTLITVENEDARQYYFEEAIKSKWSVRVLQRQIATQFYQRLIVIDAYPGVATLDMLAKRGRGVKIEFAKKYFRRAG